jgi:hypothetical protein
MRVKSFIVLMAAAVSFGVWSCGGGGGGGSFGDLAGTWFGVWEDHDFEAAFNLQMDISSGGKITNVLEDDAPVVFGPDDTLLEGQLSKDADGVYSIDWNDDSIGGIIVDDTNMHMAYLDDLFFVGILQKGATSLPVYNEQHFVGTWTGYSVWVDPNLDITDEADTVINVSSQLDVIGTTVAGAYTGSILGGFDLSRGVVSGENTAGTAFFHMFLSVDRMFAATYSCPNTYTDFYDCEFGGWAKQ